MSRRQIVMVSDHATVVRASEVARRLNQGGTMRTVAADIGVSAQGIHKLMRDAGYKQLWVTVEGQCVECGAPNGGGYVTPGCPACVDLKHGAWPR